MEGKVIKSSLIRIAKRAKAKAKAAEAPLTQENLRKMDAYWRAANYLGVGQIYLLDNPLLKEPLRIEPHREATYV